MRRLTGSLTAKITAFILLFLSLIGLLVSFIGVVVLAKSDAYVDGGRSFRNSVIDACSDHYEGYLREYVDPLMFPNHWEFEEAAFNDFYGEEHCNYFFTLYNENDEVVLTNYTPAEDEVLRDYGSRPFSGYYVDYSDPLYVGAEGRETAPTNYVYNGGYYDEDGTYYDEYYREYSYELTLKSGVRGELTAKDRIYYGILYAELLINNRYLLITLLPILAVFSLLLVIFLVCAAGHHRGEQEARLNTLDRVPFDLYLGIIAALIFGIIVIISEGFDDDFWIVILYVLAVPLTMAILLTLATRLKTGTLLNNLILTRIVNFLIRCAKQMAHLALQLPLYWKAATAWGVYSLIELVFFLTLYSSDDRLMVFWTLKTMIGTALVVVVTLQMQKLRKAGHELADGNITYTVNTEGMLPSFKEHGEHLNGIGEGLKVAVDKGIRSERMRAELITNVSHDIKTPLTSIINYVDLLKLEGLDSDNAAEYLSVLERQSARLKKLTEDLIEASKASTGAIRVQIAPLDANILLQQATAEFEEKLTAQGLVLVPHYATENTYILGDGRLLWRVFDNLLSNIIKYAKSDTRVYVSTASENGRVIITFKNISKEALDISPDELTERFVRGDSSRNTEGSGLGLSIAKSLTELQGGTFDIYIDGDLFKTVITLQEMRDEG